jgi:WXXGXW repeat (2 copies)
MRKRILALLLLAALTTTGCYGRVHGNVGVRGGSAFSNLAAAALTVAAVAVIVSSTPPVVTHVEYYDYGSRPGYCWVNGRYVYVGNQWQWQAGYWQPEQPGYYWVQGYWAPQGGNYVWVEGRWEAPRRGYVYVDGYWDARGNGYVWVPGNWERHREGYVYVGGSWSNRSGRRAWQRGGWQRDDGRAEWSRWRARGSVRGSVSAPPTGNGGVGVRTRPR